MRVMALDVGDRRIGVALSDPDGQLATPLTTIQRKSKRSDVQAVLDLVREHSVERIVIGLPRLWDGALGSQAEKVLQFGRAVEKTVGAGVEYWNEQLTTVEAERRLLEAGVSWEERKRRIDMAAAAIILEDYLSSQRGTRNE